VVAAFKAKVRSTFDELAGTLKGLEAERGALEEALKAAEERAAVAEEALDQGASQADEQLQDMNDRVRSLTGEHEALGTAFDDARSQAERFESRALELEDEVGRLRESLATSVDGAQAEELRQQLEELESERAVGLADLDELKLAMEERDRRIAELEIIAESAQEGAAADAAELSRTEGRLREELDALRPELEQLRVENELAVEDAADAAQRVAELETELAELRESASDDERAAERSELVQLRADVDAKTSELDSAIAENAELRTTVEALQMAGGDAPSAPTAAPAGIEPGEVVALCDRMNDVVSNWKNNFMHLGNFLLDVRNASDLLRAGGGDTTAALEELEASGTAEEMQDLLQRCEDDSRTLKKDLLGFKDEVRGR